MREQRVVADWASLGSSVMRPIIYNYSAHYISIPILQNITYQIDL